MDELTNKEIQRISQIITTEHFTLQGSRNATISEANGRLSHYLSAVGSGVVAMAFVANVSDLGLVFYVFSCVIFPILIILGVVTLIRTIQISVDYQRLTQAINRIRHYYVEVAPGVKPYISFPPFDDPESVQKTMMPFHSPLQGLASTPGPIILVNSFLVGAFVGVLSLAIFSTDLLITMIVALAALAVAVSLHMIYTGHLWSLFIKKDMEVRFPSREE